MKEFTQKELEKEFKRREKLDRENLLKMVDIYKLKDGTYSTRQERK